MLKLFLILKTASIFGGNLVHIFHESLMNRSSKEKHLFQTEIFGYIIKVLYGRLIKLNASILNKTINFKYIVKIKTLIDVLKMFKL